ncbi:MAG: 4'-phosphopantetheinyl transferase family protein [Gammaproteobacteria bacterium]
MVLQWRSMDREDVPDLVPGTCHIWLLPLEQEASAYEDLLSPQEKARAERFVLPQVRNRFIVAHGAMRYWLGHYTHSMPSAVTVAKMETGKPYLLHYPHIHFNLSHSQHYALLAVTTIAPVGVDIEMLADNVDSEALVHRFFSSSEQQQFTQLNPDVKKTAFFNAWCAKEAWVKAHGITLADGLQQRNIQWSQFGDVENSHDNDDSRSESCNLPAINGFASHCLVLGKVDTWQYFR